MMALRTSRYCVLTALILLSMTITSYCQEEFLDWSNVSSLISGIENSTQSNSEIPVDTDDNDENSEDQGILLPIEERQIETEYDDKNISIPLNEPFSLENTSEETSYNSANLITHETVADLRNEFENDTSRVKAESRTEKSNGTLTDDSQEIRTNTDDHTGDIEAEKADTLTDETRLDTETTLAPNNENFSEYSNVESDATSSMVQKNADTETTSNASNFALVDDDEDYAYIEDVIDDDNEIRCPNECTCADTTNTDSPVGVKVDCTEQSLTNVPKGIDERVNELYLQNNGITRVNAEFSLEFPDLKKVCFKDNKISVIEIGAFHGSPELNYLCLENNQLTAFPEEVATLVNLQTLKLSGNPINVNTPITANNFEKLANIEKLYLPENTEISLVNDLCENHSTLTDVEIGEENYQCAHLITENVVDVTITTQEADLDNISKISEIGLQNQLIDDNMGKEVVNESNQTTEKMSISLLEDIHKQKEEIIAGTKDALEVISARFDENIDKAENIINKTFSGAYKATDSTLNRVLSDTELAFKAVKAETSDKFLEAIDKAGEHTRNNGKKEDNINADGVQEIEIPVNMYIDLEGNVQPAEIDSALLPIVNAKVDTEQPTKQRGKFDSQDNLTGNTETNQKYKVFEKKTEETNIVEIEKHKAKASEVHTAGGKDYLVFGLIVGFMVFVVVGIAVKKNWRSLKRRFGDRPPPSRSPTAVAPNGVGPHSPEETAPLRSDTQSPA